ncbi:MAG: hypothetical protein SF002_10670 [Alphaproteobacteria bacterium]|nr:hypothetical protein [Alphaproteobacteria bacterium]
MAPEIFALRLIAAEGVLEDHVSCQWVECPQNGGDLQRALERVRLSIKLGFCWLVIGDIERLGLSVAQVGSDPCHYGIFGMAELDPKQRLALETQLAGIVKTNASFTVCG